MTPVIFRRSFPHDLDDIHHLASLSGTGMTTLPKDKGLLKQRLEHACHSFDKAQDLPDHEYYLFVLEDRLTHRVVGTSAIEASVGHSAPFYSYKISKITKRCPILNIENEYAMLNFVNENQGKSELCTLFLDPDYRRHHHGLLLSRARFLFIANDPLRVKPTLIAEMRGVSDDEGRSPFWDGVGSHFFHLSFDEADRLTLATNKQFITDLMPQESVHVSLLPPDAQSVIGKAHASTQAALAMLLSQGFQYTDYVDIFDAGPTIEARRDEIKTVAMSRKMMIEDVVETLNEPLTLLSNTSINFLATLGPARINDQNNTCIIRQDTAHQLQLKPLDFIRIAALN